MGLFLELDPNKKEKCWGHDCKDTAVRVDYRPSYKDADGHWESIGRVLTCSHCAMKTNEAWNGLPETED